MKKQRSILHIEGDTERFMILVYVISVILVQYTTSYTEISFPVK